MTRDELEQQLPLVSEHRGRQLTAIESALIYWVYDQYGLLALHVLASNLGDALVLQVSLRLYVYLHQRHLTAANVGPYNSRAEWDYSDPQLLPELQQFLQRHVRPD